MKRYVVSCLSFYDNCIESEIIEAESLKHAIGKHSIFSLSVVNAFQWIMSMPDDLESIKEEFFNSDMAIDVVEV